MNIDSTMRVAAMPHPNEDSNGKVVDTDDAVQKYVRKFFPDYKKKEIVDPPHIDAFYGGLKNIALRSPKAGDSARTVKEIESGNRKAIYKYVSEFTAGGDKKVYRKMIDRGMALERSRELNERDISYGAQEKATLDKALKATFTAVSGNHSMAQTEFKQSMMLGSEEFKIDDEEW
jgi:hypothetical protein